MRNFISDQELEPIRRHNYEKPLEGLGKNRSCAVCSSYLGYPTSCPLTTTAFFSFYLNPSSLLPTPFCLLISSSVLPLPGITLLLFYQPEPWIKPSSGKNLITFRIYKGFVGRQNGQSGTRVRNLNSVFISATLSYMTIGKSFLTSGLHIHL